MTLLPVCPGLTPPPDSVHSAFPVCPKPSWKRRRRSCSGEPSRRQPSGGDVTNVFLYSVSSGETQISEGFSVFEGCDIDLFDL